MKASFDTNILVYAEGVNGLPRATAAQLLIEQLPADLVVLPIQTLGELFNVLVRKAGLNRREAQARIFKWMDTYPVIDTTGGTLKQAADLTAVHGLNIWDAVILSVAASAGCRILLSEDMQDGFSAAGITTVNPFALKPHPLLAQLIGTS